MPQDQKPTPPTPPTTPDTWLYDMIMVGIEPDLMSGNIEHLDEKYSGETDDQKKGRLASYEKAFAVFDDVYAKVAGQCTQDAHAAHDAVRAEREKEEHQEHVQEIHDAESQITTDTQP